MSSSSGPSARSPVAQAKELLPMNGPQNRWYFGSLYSDDRPWCLGNPDIQDNPTAIQTISVDWSVETVGWIPVWFKHSFYSVLTSVSLSPCKQ